MGTPILFTPLRTFKTGYEAREETLNWWVENENQVMLWNRVTGTAAAALTARALKFPVSPWDIGLPARNSLTRVGRRVWGVNPFREIRGTHTLPSKELFVFYSLVSWHVPILKDSLTWFNMGGLPPYNISSKTLSESTYIQTKVLSHEFKIF